MLNIKLNYEVANKQNDLFTPNHVKYACMLKANGRQYTFEYQCNPQYSKPTVDDCLYALMSDMQCFECAKDIEDFMFDLGYAGYKEAERAYKACRRTAKAMHRMFTDEQLDEIYDVVYEM